MYVVKNHFSVFLNTVSLQTSNSRYAIAYSLQLHLLHILWWTIVRLTAVCGSDWFSRKQLPCDVEHQTQSLATKVSGKHWQVLHTRRTCPTLLFCICAFRVLLRFWCAIEVCQKCVGTLTIFSNLICNAFSATCCHLLYLCHEILSTRCRQRKKFCDTIAVLH